MIRRPAFVTPLIRALRLLAALFLCAAATFSSGAGAAPDTLAAIAERGYMSFGVRQSSPPFSYVPEGAGRAVGYAVELCDRVASAVRQRLRQPALEVRHVVVTPADRIAKLQSGDIDLECGSTTNTRARQAEVGFSYSFFITGMRLMTRRDSGIREVRDVEGRTVVTTGGTSAETLLKREAEIGWMRGAKLVLAEDHTEALAMVADGRADAFAMDDILLAGLIGKAEKPEDFDIVGKYVSIEPYALMFRKDDPAFATLVNETLGKLMQGGEILAIYDKWLATPTFNFPATPLIRESFESPDSTPAFP